MLLSFPPLHNSVGSETGARHAKLFLNQAEINVTVYIAHSTSISSSSKLENVDLSLKNYQKAVDWSYSSTFRKFYKQPLQIIMVPKGHTVTKQLIFWATLIVLHELQFVKFVFCVRF